MLGVSDNGCGMDELIKIRLFEPFFTTKAKGKGTGLGLATVHGIIEQTGGHIAVDSERGHGTSFKVYLPQETANGEAVALHSVQVQATQGRETVLVVEDEDGIRHLAREFLERCGYTVLEARDGDEALRLGETYPSPIHLMVTDVIMPQMSGPNLAERVALLRPDLKVLYMSGYTDDAIIQYGGLGQGTAFLQKPFTPDTLACKIREVLDTPQEGGDER
jgi:CheY-like chemotaxis protein